MGFEITDHIVDALTVQRPIASFPSCIDTKSFLWGEECSNRRQLGAWLGSNRHIPPPLDIWQDGRSDFIITLSELAISLDRGRHLHVISGDLLSFCWTLSAGWPRVPFVLEESPGSAGHTAR